MYTSSGGPQSSTTQLDIILSMRTLIRWFEITSGRWIGMCHLSLHRITVIKCQGHEIVIKIEKQN